MTRSAQMAWVVVTLLVLALAGAAALAQEAPRSATQVHRFEVASGHPRGWKGHVVDHAIPLCAGGLDDPSNMRWQTTKASYAKDGFERALCNAMRREGYVLVKRAQ